MEEALLLRIKLGCRSGKPAHVDSAVRSVICVVHVCDVFVLSLSLSVFVAVP